MRAYELGVVAILVATLGCEKRGGQQPGEQEGGEVQEVGGEAGDVRQDERKEASEPQAGEPEAGGPQGKAGERAGGGAQERATVRATVQSVDFGSGNLVLEGPNGPLTLHARPFELRQLVPGDVIQVNYGSFGDQLWVLPPGDTKVDASAYGQQTTLTGPVEKLDREAGTLRVRGQQLHCHPAQLMGMTTGQPVKATFVRVEDVPWISHMEPAPAEPPET